LEFKADDFFQKQKNQFNRMFNCFENYPRNLATLLKVELMKHLLSLEKLPNADIEKILRDSIVFKRERRGWIANACRTYVGADFFEIVHANQSFILKPASANWAAT